MCVSIHVLRQQKDTRFCFVYYDFVESENESPSINVFFYGIFCHAFEARKLKIIQNEGGDNLET